MLLERVVWKLASTRDELGLGAAGKAARIIAIARDDKILSLPHTL